MRSDVINMSWVGDKKKWAMQTVVPGLNKKEEPSDLLYTGQML